MKVATITFQNTTNYGASLQCYALHRALQMLGADTEVIQYDSPYLNKPYKMAALREKGIIRFILGNIWTLMRTPRNGNFAEFNKNIKFTRTVTPATIGSLESEYDLFLTGSDQVWNGNLSGHDPNYFLGFVKDNRKKGSYAASFGFLNVPEGETEWYKKQLAGYKYYNVRETSGQKLVKELTGCDAKLTIDPTLLLKQDEWKKVMKAPNINEPYILVYQITPSRKLSEVVNKLKKQTGHKVIAIPFIMDWPHKFKSMFTIGPAEFLGLFCNASYVVTDSFHGTAFSLIFNCNFWTLSSRKESRITSLLEILGLGNRILYFDDAVNNDLTIEASYNDTNIKFDEYRQKALDVIKSMINETK